MSGSGWSLDPSLCGVVVIGVASLIFLFSISHKVPVRMALSLEQNVALNELKRVLRSDRVALLCGAGVSMAISNDGMSWSGLVNQYAQRARTIMGLNENWYQTQIAAVDLMVGLTDTEKLFRKINNICHIINVAWNPPAPGQAATDLYKHRIVAQMIMRRMSLDRPQRGILLHNLGCLILTTNYDMVIEECIPLNRFSLSHVEALGLGIDSFAGNTTLAPGPYFGNPSRSFVVHVHGRYFDFADDNGFTLTTAEYDNPVMNAKFLQFMVPVAVRKSLVFVGATGTINDVHFMNLWAQLAANNSRVKHYVLHSEQQRVVVEAVINEVRGTVPDVNLVSVCYGAENQNWSVLWDDVIPYLSA